MRRALVVAIAVGGAAVGCSGGGEGSEHWTFTAVANVSEGPLRIDFSAGAGLDPSGSGSGFHLFGAEVGGACVHTVDFYSGLPLATQTYDFQGYQGTAVATYTDCHVGGTQYPLMAGSGDLDVTRFPDSSCPAPPCIDARFAFIMTYYVFPNMYTFYVQDGHISNR